MHEEFIDYGGYHTHMPVGYPPPLMHPPIYPPPCIQVGKQSNLNPVVKPAACNRKPHSWVTSRQESSFREARTTSFVGLNSMPATSSSPAKYLTAPTSDSLTSRSDPGASNEVSST